MKASVLLDTGPWVALFNKRDSRHHWALRFFKELRPPLLTCDAVLAEVLYLLRRDSQAVSFVFGLMERKLVLSSFPVQEHAEALKKLMTKYSGLPMDFADACLVRMSELHSNCRVWTLDSDFLVYRRNGRARIPWLIPETP